MTEVSELNKRVASLERQVRQLATGRRETRCCTKTDAAKYIGRSREHIRHLIQAGRIKPNADGTIDFATLDAMLDEEGRA
jgi:hypothetical protein